MNEIETVKMNKKEQTLFDAICWDESETDSKVWRESLEKMGQLTESLLNRGVIPKTRLKWFADPDLNGAGYGRSVKQVYEKNGTRGKEIFRHPHFMKVLRYFIFGPQLPQDTIQGFCKIIEDDAGTSGMVLDQIQAFVRKEVRNKGLDKHKAADEFFKLAYEIDAIEWAEVAQSAAKTVRK